MAAPVALSNYDKEVRRWETFRSQGGMRPDTFQEYPKMLYKARKKPTGGPFQCVDPYDDSFSTANQHAVGNREEEERARREGWRNSPKEAVDYATSLEDDISRAAAERQDRDKWMSEKARVEAQAVDDSTFEHVAEIPEAPVVKVRRKPGPKPKNQPVA